MLTKGGLLDFNQKGKIMQSEFNKGASYCRDCIISNIIGMQNDIGNDTNDNRYQILQELLEYIENYYGKMCSDFKG